MVPLLSSMGQNCPGSRYAVDFGSNGNGLEAPLTG